MKVLHIISTYKPAYVYGGPVMSISRLCEGLSAIKKISLTLITTNANGKQDLPVITNKELKIDGVNVIYFKRVTGDPHETSPSLWRYVINHCQEYDIVHVHSWWNLIAVISVFICLVKRKKIIVSPRGMLSNYILRTNNKKIKALSHRIIGKYILSKTYFHATADQEARECETLIKGWKGFTIPNIAELPNIEIKKKENEVFTIGFLSRIDRKKGIEFVLQTLSRLRFPFVFIIAGQGDDDYIDELKQLASELSVADKIKWVGWKDQVNKFYELMNFDLFILSSYNENFANVVVEALYMGTPVCISQYVGLAEFVKTNELGWITDLTIESIEDNIVNAYQQVDKRKKIELTARQIILSSFSEKVVLGQYMNMYDFVLNH